MRVTFLLVKPLRVLFAILTLLNPPSYTAGLLLFMSASGGVFKLCLGFKLKVNFVLSQ